MTTAVEQYREDIQPTIRHWITEECRERVAAFMRETGNDLPPAGIEAMEDAAQRAAYSSLDDVFSHYTSQKQDTLHSIHESGDSQIYRAAMYGFLSQLEYQLAYVNYRLEKREAAK